MLDFFLQQIFHYGEFQPETGTPDDEVITSSRVSWGSERDGWPHSQKKKVFFWFVKGIQRNITIYIEEYYHLYSGILPFIFQRHLRLVNDWIYTQPDLMIFSETYRCVGTSQVADGNGTAFDPNARGEPGTAEVRANHVMSKTSSKTPRGFPFFCPFRKIFRQWEFLFAMGKSSKKLRMTYGREGKTPQKPLIIFHPTGWDFVGPTHLFKICT